MSHLDTTARSIDEIGSELADLHEQIRTLYTRIAPVQIELVRAKVHALIPDAQTVTLYVSEWDNGWFYSDDAEITCTDGTVTRWLETVEEAIADGADVAEDGGLDQVLLADLSETYGANQSSTGLVLDLVHLSAQGD